jgi:50S ribosomal protein L16 3-hydroxylase
MSTFVAPRFLDDIFNAKPVVIPNAPRLASEAEVFDLLASLPDHPWPAAERMFRFFDGTRAVDDPFRCLPRAADGSFDGYAQRASRELCESGEFCLVVNKVCELSPMLWERARRFLVPLFAHVGFAPGPTNTQLFLSNCRYTPFGVHKDFASVFSTVVRGPKRMLVWPYDALHHLVDDADTDLRYEGYELEGLDAASVRDEATLLHGESGDLLYWPATHWHVGAADERRSLSLTFNVSVASTQPRHVFDALTEHMMRRGIVPPPAVPTARDARGQVALPAQLKAIEGALRAMIDGGELAEVLAEGWMEHVSAYGFVERPGPREVELHPATRLRGDPAFPVLWQHRRDGSIVVCANGRTIYFEADRGILDLIAALNTGETLAVADLVARVQGAEHGLGWDGATTEAFLGELARWRAVELVET